MKGIALTVLLITLLLASCLKEEEPILCHLYGWAKSESDSTTGINNLILQIKDINPANLSYQRIRETTTKNEDSVAGFFEMDSVCYGTTYQQGTGFVIIAVDSMKNPTWPTQYWAPTILNAVDTIILYVTPQ